MKTIFNEILESQEIPETWREAKMIILQKKRGKKRHEELQTRKPTIAHV